MSGNKKKNEKNVTMKRVNHQTFLNNVCYNLKLIFFTAVSLLSLLK